MEPWLVWCLVVCGYLLGGITVPALLLRFEFVTLEDGEDVEVLVWFGFIWPIFVVISGFAIIFFFVAYCGKKD